jgi:hypothetical protein
MVAGGRSRDTQGNVGQDAISSASGTEENALEEESMAIIALHRNVWHGQCREHTDLSGSSEIEGEGLRFDVPSTSARRGAFLTRPRSGVSSANGI